MMNNRKNNLFNPRRKMKDGDRFLIALILLLLVALCAYAYLYRDQLPWRTKKASQLIIKEQADSIKQPFNTNPKFVEVEQIIEVDAKTQEHLKTFHERVLELSNTYPDTFIFQGPQDQKNIALTIDDGPELLNTPMILQTLQKYQVKATFFLLGEQIARYPLTTKKIQEAGHEIGNHSYSHPHFDTISLQKAKVEILKTEVLCREVLDVTPKIIRPPYGMMTEEQIHYYKEKGYKIVDWSVDPMDWYTQNENSIYTSVIHSIHNGAIILLHCSGNQNRREATIKAIDRMIPTLQNQGYRFVTVSQLLK